MQQSAMTVMSVACLLLMLASSAYARHLHGAGGRPAGQDKGAGNDDKPFPGNIPDNNGNNGRRVGHVFKFDKEPRGAAGFLDDMDADSPGKLQRVMARSKWQGGKNKLAEELEHDNDLVSNCTPCSVVIMQYSQVQDQQPSAVDTAPPRLMQPPTAAPFADSTTAVA
jgi:hypothetical protein